LSYGPKKSNPILAPTAVVGVHRIAKETLGLLLTSLVEKRRGSGFSFRGSF
jgi:hypothetical protein